MKTSLTAAILFAACLTSLPALAKIWRVNSNAGISADFVQLSTAISNAAVQNDDTIYVEGAANSYNSVALNKRLVIIGPGYFLAENTGLQASTAESSISNISLDTLASGSKFYGLRIGMVYANSNVDNILVARCHASIGTNNSTPNSKMVGWTITQSYLNSVSFNSSAYVFENLQITNCFVQSALSFTGVINGLIRNNIFFNHVTINNAYIANNIFLNFPTLALTNCTVKNNIAQSNVLPATNNNQNSIAPATLFALTGSTDGRYQLRPGSPAIGTGETVNGETPDCGVFGTADPYRLSGIPPIPTIYALTVPVSVPSSASSMSITVSTRSNN